MDRFVVSRCSTDDGPSISKVFISAFWTDPTWVIIWPGKSQEYVTAQHARRMPHTLLSNRAHHRHQKVVDTDTNAVVGYSRWTLPQIDNLNTESLWSAAQVPSVTQEQERHAEAEFAAADYAYDRSLDELDGPMDEMVTRLMSQNKYAVRAKKAALKLYQKAGFVLVDQSVLDASKFGIEVEYGAYFLAKEAEGKTEKE